MLLERFAPDQAAVSEMDRRYDEGLLGSRELMRWDMDVLPGDPEALASAAIAMPLDRPSSTSSRSSRRPEASSRSSATGSVSMSVRCSRRSVSVGCPWRRTSLCRAAAARRSHSRSATRPVTSAGPASVSVRLHRNEGRAVVFVGDGASDRYAAHHADVVFAKEALARYCDRERLATSDGSACQTSRPGPWRRSRTVGCLSIAPRGRSGRRCIGPGRERFICGPEAWGEDAAARLLPIGGDARYSVRPASREVSAGRRLSPRRVHWARPWVRSAHRCSRSARSSARSARPWVRAAHRCSRSSRPSARSARLFGPLGTSFRRPPPTPPPRPWPFPPRRSSPRSLRPGASVARRRRAHRRVRRSRPVPRRSGTASGAEPQPTPNG